MPHTEKVKVSSPPYLNQNIVYYIIRYRAYPYVTLAYYSRTGFPLSDKVPVTQTGLLSFDVSLRAFFIRGGGGLKLYSSLTFTLFCKESRIQLPAPKTLPAYVHVFNDRSNKRGLHVGEKCCFCLHDVGVFIAFKFQWRIKH